MYAVEFGRIGRCELRFLERYMEEKNYSILIKDKKVVHKDMK